MTLLFARKLLFSSTAVLRVTKRIEIAIDNFEPRVNNVRVLVEPRPDENTFEATVVFDIIGQQFPTQEFSFLLEATR